MAIRENERKVFLEDRDLKRLQNTIKKAKKYKEGYALRFKIENDKDLQMHELLIKKLLTIRTKDSNSNSKGKIQ